MLLSFRSESVHCRVVVRVTTTFELSISYSATRHHTTWVSDVLETARERSIPCLNVQGNPAAKYVCGGITLIFPLTPLLHSICLQITVFKCMDDYLGVNICPAS